MNKVKSPITKTYNVQHIASFNPSIMSDSKLTDREVDNYICLDTGLIFNASGPRGLEKGFYTDEYDLHSENALSEFKYFEDGQVFGIYEDILKFITENISFSNTGRVLDIGCGKGLFLKKFAEQQKKWEVYGVEPSRNAKKFFEQVLPEAKICEGIFEDSSFKNEKFDLITANGVLEHVPDPIAFLKSIRSSLNENGYLYIGVPNFENNPADLFTYDHLSRFTPETIKLAFELSGFEIVASKISDLRVPMWFLLKLSEPKQNPLNKDNIERAENLANKSLSIIKAFFKSYDEAAQEAIVKGNKVIMYGTGAFGLIGTCYTKLKKELISKILDDNSTVWGSERLNITIANPQELVTTPNVSEVVISANPCYLDSIRKKIELYIKDKNIKLHIPGV